LRLRVNFSLDSLCQAANVRIAFEPAKEQTSMATALKLPEDSILMDYKLKTTDTIGIIEIAEVIGFKPAEVISAIERHRSSLDRDYYSIPELSVRWRCSRALVYRVLRQSGFKLLNLCLPTREDSTKPAFNLRRGNADKGKRLIPRYVVEHIEKARMERLPEVA
jgi:hypothetical protein